MTYYNIAYIKSVRENIYKYSPFEEFRLSNYNTNITTDESNYTYCSNNK